jgi:glutathione S-transferase
MITLYQLERCPWCAAARQGLRNVRMERYTVVNVPRDRTERDVLEELSGQRLVPVIVDDDLVVWDSRRIVRYLYSTYGGSERAQSISELADAPGGQRRLDGDATPG